MTTRKHFKTTAIQLEKLEGRELCAVDMALAHFHPVAPTAPAMEANIAKPIAATAHDSKPAVHDAPHANAAASTTPAKPVTPSSQFAAPAAGTATTAAPAATAKPTVTVNSPVLDKLTQQVQATRANANSDLAQLRKELAGIKAGSKIDLTSSLGKKIEELLKKVTPNVANRKVEVKEFSINAKGDLVIKAQVKYSGKINLGFFNQKWSVTAKVEIKTNLFDSSSIKMDVSIGKLPAIGINFHSGIVKDAMKAWIVTSSVKDVRNALA